MFHFLHDFKSPPCCVQKSADYETDEVIALHDTHEYSGTDLRIEALMEWLKNDVRAQLSQIDQKIDDIRESVADNLINQELTLGTSTDSLDLHPVRLASPPSRRSDRHSALAQVRPASSPPTSPGSSRRSDRQSVLAQVRPASSPPTSPGTIVAEFRRPGSLKRSGSEASGFSGPVPTRSDRSSTQCGVTRRSVSICSEESVAKADPTLTSETPDPTSPHIGSPTNRLSIASRQTDRSRTTGNGSLRRSSGPHIGSPTNRLSIQSRQTDRSRHSSASHVSRLSVYDTIRNMDQIRRTVDGHRIDKDTNVKHARMKVWIFLENRFSSIPAYCYAVFVPIFVVTGVCISFWQTVDGSALEGTAGEVLQTIYEVAFALELSVRFIVCPSRRQFMSSIFNYIDAMSALPLLLRLTRYILESSGTGKVSDDMLRIVSVVPVLRLLRLTRTFETFQLLLTAFQVALEALPVLLYILMLIALIFSALIYFVEPLSNIGSLPTALWFTIVTMTTVGYGDIVPESVSGHVVAMLLIIISALYMAIPIGIVGNAFSVVWGDRDRLLLMQRMRDTFLEGGFTASVVIEIFRLFDNDGNGELDIDEFSLMLRTMQINISDARVDKLFHALDTKGTGQIVQRDLVDSLFPKSYVDKIFENPASQYSPTNSTGEI